MIVILSDSCLLYHWGGGIACFLTLDVRFIWNSKCFQTVPRSNICWMYCACVSFASHLTAVHSPGCKVSEDLVKFLSWSWLSFLSEWVSLQNPESSSLGLSMGEAMLQLLLVRNGNASVPVLMLTRCFFFVGFLLFFFFSTLPSSCLACSRFCSVSCCDGYAQAEW